MSFAPDPERACRRKDGTSKVAYYDRSKAKAGAARLIGPDWRGTHQVYLCDRCHFFHIGRNSWYGKTRRHYQDFR